MNRFVADTTVTRLDATRYEAECAAGWRVIGDEVMNGGYVLALGARAMADHAERPDPVTLTSHFLAPLRPGPVEITTETVRAGGRHRTVAGSLRQEGRECARMLGTFGDLTHATGPSAPRLVAPSGPLPEDVPVADLREADGSPGPEVFDRLDIRMAPERTTWIHGRASGQGEQTGWCRWSDGGPMDPFGVLLVSDAYPASVFDLSSDHVGWTPTIEMTVHLFARPVGEWVLARFTANALVNGYFEEDGAIWDASGQLVASSRQLAMTGR